ncbi:MAG: hypothetical protein HOK28_12045, partial [Deltaproteobacteria bacterium]|nr:hypothetical protein [Deltaproteobacteria bacterium]
MLHPRTSLLLAFIAACLLLGCGAGSPESSSPDSQTDSGAPTPSSDDNQADTDANDEDTNVEGAPATLAIVEGLGIGGVEIGDTFAEIKAILGEPESPMGYNRMIVASWPQLGLEIFFASELDFEINDAAWAMSMNTTQGDGFSGSAIPGMNRSQIETEVGTTNDETLGYAFYECGLVVQYD